MKRILLLLVGLVVFLLGETQVSEEHIGVFTQLVDTKKCRIKKTVSVYNEDLIYFFPMKKKDFEQGGVYHQHLIGKRGEKIVYTYYFKTPSGKKEIKENFVLNGKTKYTPGWNSVPEECRVKYKIFKKGEAITMKEGDVVLKNRENTVVDITVKIEDNSTILVVERGEVALLRK